MRLDVISLFPAMCEAILGESILGRAREAGAVEIGITNPRDFTTDRHRTVDDRPYGGGAGMVLRPEPLRAALEKVRCDESRVVLLTPQGRRFSQALARELAAERHLVLVCGHYEGVDERFRLSDIDDEVSIGDYVLTNGTLAALVVADAVIRLQPGALGCGASAEEESFAHSRWLEYPHYTRPQSFHGMAVPEVLTSGDHRDIEQWRQMMQAVRTAARRPDQFGPSDKDGGETDE